MKYGKAMCRNAIWINNERNVNQWCLWAGCVGCEHRNTLEFGYVGREKTDTLKSGCVGREKRDTIESGV